MTGADWDRPHLVVRAGGRRCALPLAAVQRVVRGLTMHPVPAGGPHLLGLTQFGGEPLAVVDLASILGEVAGDGGVTVILERRRTTRAGLGVAVDAVLEVARPDPGAVVRGGATPPVAAELDDDDDGTLLVLDPGAILGAGSTRPDARKEKESD